MTKLVRAELLKIRTTRTAWGLLIGLVLLVAINAVIKFLTYAFATGDTRQAGAKPPPALGDPEAIRSVLSAALSAKQLILVLGILLVTTEYRHMTATSTFLAAPRRGQVIAAKLLAGALVGVVYGAVAIGVAIITGFAAYPFKNVSFNLGVDKVPQAVGGIILVIAVYAVIGIGVGTLVKNQVAALLLALGWSLAAESITTLVLSIWRWGDNIFRWFPGNAATAITDQYLGGTFTLLRPWLGALVLVGYGLAFAVLGSLLTVRRDVT